MVRECREDGRRLCGEEAHGAQSNVHPETDKQSENRRRERGEVSVMLHALYLHLTQCRHRRFGKDVAGRE